MCEKAGNKDRYRRDNRCIRRSDRRLHKKRILYAAQARRGDFGNRGCQRKDGDRPDCFPQRKDLFPVGRLDKDTEGLLLITNDGELAHRLLSPKKHVDKTYYAKVQGIVTQEDVRKFAEGVDIHEKKLTAPAVLEVVKSGEVSEILLTICEGKFHQVKRMFEAVGKKVIYLKRLSMGPLQLDETLMPGEYRELTEKEKDTLCSVEKKQ